MIHKETAMLKANLCQFTSSDKMAKVGSSLLCNFSRKATWARSAALAKCPVFTVPLSPWAREAGIQRTGPRTHKYHLVLEIWKSPHPCFTEVTEMAKLIVFTFSFWHSYKHRREHWAPKSGKGLRPSSARGSPCRGLGPRPRPCAAVTSACGVA